MIDLDLLEALARLTNDEAILTAIRQARRGSTTALAICAVRIERIDADIAAGRAVRRLAGEPMFGGDEVR